MDKVPRRLSFMQYSFPKISNMVRSSLINSRYSKERVKVVKKSDFLATNLTESFSFKLFDFSDPFTEHQFYARDDSDYGGLSQIEKAYNEVEECLDVKGTINTEEKEKMQADPVVAITSDIYPGM